MADAGSLNLPDRRVIRVRPPFRAQVLTCEYFLGSPRVEDRTCLVVSIAANLPWPNGHQPITNDSDEAKTLRQSARSHRKSLGASSAATAQVRSCPPGFVYLRADMGEDASVTRWVHLAAVER